MTFDIDANGILHVSATDKKTNKEAKISIQGSSGLSEEEIEKAKRDAEAHAEDDKKRKEQVETRNNAEQLTYQVEKQLSEAGEQLPEELKTDVQSKIDAVKEALKGTDDAAIKSTTDALQAKLGDLMQAAQGAAAGMDPNAAAGASPQDDSEESGERAAKGKVVDAEVVEEDEK